MRSNDAPHPIITARIGTHWLHRASCSILPTNVYTVVDGKRVDMKPGDVVPTPSWCWHGHANEGNETAFWLDFLNTYADLAGTVPATIVGQADEALARADVLAAPLWHEHVLHGTEDATLLRVTDEPIMAKYGLLRRG